MKSYLLTFLLLAAFGWLAACQPLQKAPRTDSASQSKNEVLSVLPEAVTNSTPSDSTCQMKYSLDSLAWQRQEFVFLTTSLQHAFVQLQGETIRLTLLERNRHATAYSEKYVAPQVELGIIAVQQRLSQEEPSRFTADFSLTHKGKTYQWKLYGQQVCP